MTDKEIKELRFKVDSRLQEFYKEKYKGDKYLKMALANIKDHFKTDKWPLSFDFYYTLANTNDVLRRSDFVTILKDKGYKVKFTEFNELVICK